MNFIPTSEQENFINYVKSINKGMVLVDAPAGHGKTAVLKYIQSILPERCVFLAPTHKAKDVLKTDGVKHCQTIHKFLKAYRNIAKDGKEFFTFGGPYKKNKKIKTDSVWVNTDEYNKKYDEGCLIFVDEASMITDTMFEYFVEYSKKHAVIFTGDNLQLLPINTIIQDVFINTECSPNSNVNDEANLVPEIIDVDSSKLSKVFENSDISIKKFTFTKNHRCREKVSTLLLERARDAVTNKRMPDSIAHASLDEILLDFLDWKDAVILAYSNKQVNFYNSKIRSELFKKEIAKEGYIRDYYPDEVLVFTGLREDIVEIIKTKVSHGKFDLNTVKKSNIFINFKRVSNVNKEVLHLPIHLNDLPELEDKINKSDVLIDSKQGEKYVTSDKVICKHIDTVDFKLLPHKLIKFYRIVDKNGYIWYKPIDTTQFKKFKKEVYDYCYDLQKNMRYLKLSLSECWDMFLTVKNYLDADLKYGYSMTVHKSQGSQFDNVYVDRTNILQSTRQSQLLRCNCYYTAISRHRNIVRDIDPSTIK